MLGFEIQEELVSAAQKACPRAEIRNVAVADRNGQLEIYLPRNFSSDFRGGSSILKDYLSDSNIYDKRSVESLDFVELLNELKFVEDYDFIVVKMDVEGAEYQIVDALFEYFQRTGDSLIDFLLIEFHPKVLEKRSDNKLYIKKIADMGIKSVRWV